MNLDCLTESQRKAALHRDGPLIVLAGPGSGKTRVITYRIAALIDSGIQPRNICAITFTNKAADQMRQRACELCGASASNISTFHSLCVRILRIYAGQAGIGSNFSVYDTTDQKRCMRQAVKACDLDTSNFPPAKLLGAVSSLKNRLVTPEAFEEEADEFYARCLSRVYTKYQKMLDDQNGLDFDDLLMKTALLLENDEQVRNELNERFRYLLIDEYQDTNHAQYRIARSLASSHDNICATGDPDQSIYRWRGADMRNIMAFEKDWPEAVTVKLEENFRSTPNILKAADRLIGVNTNRKKKSLIPVRGKGADIELTEYDSAPEEADGVADKIQELTQKGTDLKDIAVFYRVNSQSRPLEEALIQRKIPYQIVRGIEFYSRKEIRDILAYMKVIVNPEDEVSLLRIINSPARGIGKTTISRVSAFAEQKGITFYDALKRVSEIDTLTKSPSAKITVFVKMIERFRKLSESNKPEEGIRDLFEKVFTETGMEQDLKNTDSGESTALDNVNELINAVARYDSQSEEPTLIEFLQQISLYSDTDSYDASVQRVALMTLHAAKGLEFENVFITGLEEGLLPHERSCGDDREIEEERRLMFVGITRAKSSLYLSYARYRTIRGLMMRTVASQFISEAGLKLPRSNQGGFEIQDVPASSGADQHDPYSQLTPGFRPNQSVYHKKFGSGRVKEFIDMGENSVVVVKFNTGTTKSLMLKYARLETH